VLTESPDRPSPSCLVTDSYIRSAESSMHAPDRLDNVVASIRAGRSCTAASIHAAQIQVSATLANAASRTGARGDFNISEGFPLSERGFNVSSGARTVKQPMSLTEEVARGEDAAPVQTSRTQGRSSESPTVLSQCSPLAHLKLGDNSIGKQGAKRLAEAPANVVSSSDASERSGVLEDPKSGILTPNGTLRRASTFSLPPSLLSPSIPSGQSLDSTHALSALAQVSPMLPVRLPSAAGVGIVAATAVPCRPPRGRRLWESKTTEGGVTVGASAGGAGAGGGSSVSRTGRGDPSSGGCAPASEVVGVLEQSRAAAERLDVVQARIHAREAALLLASLTLPCHAP
jgi:hypothetical protein